MTGNEAAPSRKDVRRALALAVALTMLALGPVGAASAGPFRAATPGARAHQVSRLLWANRFDLADDFGGLVAVSPDGTRVYGAGQTHPVGDNLNSVLVVAHDSGTGNVVWSTTISPGDHRVRGFGISPDGSVLFVTGYVILSFGGNWDIFTTALRAATGEVLWSAFHDGPGETDIANGLAVSPDGRSVYVTGYVEQAGSFVKDLVTIAYRTDTGKQVWLRRYKGGGNSDGAWDVAAAADAVYVTGAATGTDRDFVTVAYRANTGEKLWANRYDGPAHLDDSGYAIALSPDGSAVFAAGVQNVDLHDPRAGDFAVIAYDSLTGARLWVSGHDGLKHGSDTAHSLAVSPDGSTVYAAGSTAVTFHEDDFLVLALAAGSGAARWVATYDGAGSDDAIEFHAAVTSPDGATLYVTGRSRGGPATAEDIATLAFDTSNGSQRWAERYTGPSKHGDDIPASTVLGPDGTVLYVGGISDGGSKKKFDVVMLAYSAA